MCLPKTRPHADGCHLIRQTSQKMLTRYASPSNNIMLHIARSLNRLNIKQGTGSGLPKPILIHLKGEKKFLKISSFTRIRRMDFYFFRSYDEQFGVDFFTISGIKSNLFRPLYELTDPEGNVMDDRYATILQCIYIQSKIHFLQLL